MYLRARARARARVCVCVCVCVFGSVNLTLNPTPIYPLTLTTTAFQPQSNTELQDAVMACGDDPVKKSDPMEDFLEDIDSLNRE